MKRWQALRELLDQAAAGKQIGTPVAARIVAHLTADHGHTVPAAIAALEATLIWFDDEAAWVKASGDAAAGQVTLLLKTIKGRTAIISAGTSGVGRPLVEAILFGTRGMASCETSDAIITSSDDASVEISARGRVLLDAMQQSLRTGGVCHLARGAPREISKRAMPRMNIDHGPAQGSPTQPPYSLLMVAGDHTHQPMYAAAFARDDRCRLIGVTDEPDIPARRQQLNRGFAERMGVPLLDDYSAALARDDVDVVCVCAEPERRGPLLVQAARAGKHLYLDKPLTGTVADAAEVVASIEAAGVHAHMFSFVHSALAERLRAALQSGDLGDLLAVHFDVTFAKGPAGTADIARARRESAEPTRFELADAKRELTNIGVYPLTQLGWLLDPNIHRVTAATGNYFFAQHQARDMEDFGAMLLELDGGVTATLIAARNGWRSHPASGLNRAYLIGTRRALVVDLYRPRVEVWADDKPWEAPPPDPDDPMGMWPATDASQRVAPKSDWLIASPDVVGRDVSYFLDCLETGCASDVSYRLAATATAWLAAAYRAAADEHTVRLSDT